jgi:hypothetical protein
MIVIAIARHGLDDALNEVPLTHLNVTPLQFDPMAFLFDNVSQVHNSVFS